MVRADETNHSADQAMGLHDAQADVVARGRVQHLSQDSWRATAILAGDGYLAPVGTNATEEDRALNRRVELAAR
jgi:flagellar motor protein MotB